MHEAFVALHARHLNGFALLMCLGDRELARRLVGEALLAGLQHPERHRHPERAAAWLRARVVAATPRRTQLGASGIGALAEIGAVEGVALALGSLSRLERAGLIAREIEGLDPRDVATVVGRDARGLDGLLERARRRYLAAYLDLAPPLPPIGPVAQRLHEVGEMVIG